MMMPSGNEALLAALRAGVSPAGWAMLAREAGVSDADAGALLDRLEPVLHAPRTTASARVLVTGDGVLAQSIADLLGDLGLLARASEREPDLAVLVAGWVLGPDDAAPWLRRDVPHLPVVAADRDLYSRTDQVHTSTRTLAAGSSVTGSG